MPEGGPQRAGPGRAFSAVAGTASVGLGIAVAAWPEISLLLFSRLAGWGMALLALSTVVEAGAGGRWRSWATLGGVAAGGLGVCLLVWPGRTLLVATALGGAWLIVDGMGRVLDTVTARSVKAEIVGNVAGVVEALVGVAVIARPVGGLRASAVLFGVGLVAGGLRRVWSATRPAGDLPTSAPVQR